jgi:hypothetical protein
MTRRAREETEQPETTLSVVAGVFKRRVWTEKAPSDMTRVPTGPEDLLELAPPVEAATLGAPDIAETRCKLPERKEALFKNNSLLFLFPSN